VVAAVAAAAMSSYLATVVNIPMYITLLYKAAKQKIVHC